MQLKPISRSLPSPAIRADVVRLTDRGDGAEFCAVVSKLAAHGAFEFFGDDKPDTLNGVGQAADISDELDGVILRQHAPPIQKFTLQNTADERCISDGKENVLRARIEGCGVLGVAEDFFDFF